MPPGLWKPLQHRGGTRAPALGSQQGLPPAWGQQGSGIPRGSTPAASVAGPGYPWRVTLRPARGHGAEQGWVAGPHRCHTHGRERCQGRGKRQEGFCKWRSPCRAVPGWLTQSPAPPTTTHRAAPAHPAPAPAQPRAGTGLRLVTISHPLGGLQPSAALGDTAPARPWPPHAAPARGWQPAGTRVPGEGVPGQGPQPHNGPGLRERGGDAGSPVPAGSARRTRLTGSPALPAPGQARAGGTPSHRPAAPAGVGGEQPPHCHGCGDPPTEAASATRLPPLGEGPQPPMSHAALWAERLPPPRRHWAPPQPGGVQGQDPHGCSPAPTRGCGAPAMGPGAPHSYTAQQHPPRRDPSGSLGITPTPHIPFPRWTHWGGWGGAEGIPPHPAGAAAQTGVHQIPPTPAGAGMPGRARRAGESDTGIPTGPPGHSGVARPRPLPPCSWRGWRGGLSCTRPSRPLHPSTARGRVPRRGHCPLPLPGGAACHLCRAVLLWAAPAPRRMLRAGAWGVSGEQDGGEHPGCPRCQRHQTCDWGRCARERCTPP